MSVVVQVEGCFSLWFGELFIVFEKASVGNVS